MTTTMYRNRFNGRTLSQDEVRKKELQLSLYNQLHGTDYNKDSIGIQTVVSHHGFEKHVNANHFAYNVFNENPNIKVGR